MTCVGLVQVERGQPAQEQQGGQGGRQPGPWVQSSHGDHHHRQSVTPIVIKNGAPCIMHHYTESRGVTVLSVFLRGAHSLSSFIMQCL